MVNEQLRLECGLSPPGWVHLASGWEADIYAGETNGLSLVLRLYASTPTDAIMSPDPAREFSIMKSLFRAGYPVPEVYSRGVTPPPVERPYLVMERVRGESLGRVWKHAGPGKRSSLTRWFCSLLGDLHRLPLSSAPIAAGAGGGSAGAMSARLADFIGTVCPRVLGTFGDWLGERSVSVSDEGQSLLHWDFHPENILVQAEGVARVIDWRNAETGDPRFDVGATLVLVGDGFRQGFLKEYRAGASELRDLDFFVAVACVRRLLVITAALRYGPESIGLLPRVREYLPGIAPHVEEMGARLETVTGLRGTGLQDLARALRDSG